MPHIHAVPAGLSIARHTAAHLLMTVPADALARAVLLLPNRRSCGVMRAAFQQQLDGKAALLPRMVSLAEIDTAFIHLVGDAGLAVLESIPPAMQAHHQRYLLARPAMRRDQRRLGHLSLRQGERGGAGTDAERLV